MKKLAIQLAEGAIVGVLMGVLMFVLGIEAAAWQFAAICGGAIIFTSIARGICKVFIKGEPLYDYQWIYQYREHTITVKINKAAELYIDGKLLDSKTGIALAKVELKGLLDSKEKITATISGERIKKAISSDISLRCELLVNGKPLQAVAV